LAGVVLAVLVFAAVVFGVPVFAVVVFAAVVFDVVVVLGEDALAVVVLPGALVFGAGLAAVPAGAPVFAGALVDACGACGVNVDLGLCARKGTMA
jgi:hypothetical protein